MAILYYRPDGDDSLAGTSPATARKSLITNGSAPSSTTNATTRFAAGDTILLARGGIWVPPTTDIGNRFMMDPSVSVHSQQYIGSYDAGLGSNQPILDPLLYDDGTGWTLYGAGVWTKTYSATDAVGLYFRCWAGMTGPTSVRSYDSMRLMSSAAACVSEKQFYCNGLVAYVYSGSENPFIKYGGIAFARRIFGSVSTAVRLRALDGESWLDGVTIRGSVLSQGGMRNARIEYVRLESMGGSGLNFSDAASLNQNILFKNTTIDWYTSTGENQADSTGGSAGFGSWDGISMSAAFTAGNGALDIRVVDPNIKGARHACVSFYNLNPAFKTGVSGISVRSTSMGRSVFDCDGIDTGRGFAAATTGFSIDGIRMVGMTGQSQLAGYASVRRCEWLKNRALVTQPDNNGGDNCIAIGTPYFAGDVVPGTSIDVEACLFDNPVNFTMVVVADNLTATPIQSSDIRFIGNTVIDQTYYNSKRTDQAVPWGSLPGSTFYFFSNSNITVPFPVFKNNLVILPAGAAGVYLHNNWSSYSNPFPLPPSSYSGGAAKTNTYTINDATAPTVPLNNAKYDTLSAAGCDGYVPLLTSPLVSAGGNMMAKNDLAGNIRWNPPSIGAYEAVRVRATRL